MTSPGTWIGLLVSAAAIAFLAWTVDGGKLLAALGEANLGLVVACAATVPVTMYLKAYRWRYFFPDPTRVSMGGLLSALYLGYMANTVLPLRAGEILRAYLVGESDRISKSTVLATVLIEKVLDLGTVAFMLFALRFLIPLPDWADAAALASGVGVAVGTIGLAVALAARGLALKTMAGLEARVGLLRHVGATALLESFLDGLAFVRDARVLAIVVLWTVVLWAGGVVTLYLGLAAVGIAPTVAMTVFVLVVTNLGMAVPSAPGYVGVYHQAVIVSLLPYGIDQEQGLAAAIILHVVIFGAFIVGGLFFLARGRAERGADRGLGELVARARSSPGERPTA